MASAQDVSRYRTYVLESTVESVVAASGARASDVKTIHERPAKIQELQWRAPYVSSGSQLADPVRDIAFTFIDDALYQIVVSYDRHRTDGLTNTDVIETLTAAYGLPVLKSARAGTVHVAVAPTETTVLAQWETAPASLTLVRGAYTPEFQVILISKASSTRARSAIREAVRLDAAEAPQRESAQRKREAADATAAGEKTRDTNKAAFRP
jgi:hypothetical protein